MLDLDDFLHLPELDPIVGRILTAGPGLIVVAGFDPPESAAASADAILPSGRSTVFRILFRRFLQSDAFGRVFAIARDREALRVPRGDRKRVEVIAEPSPAAIALRIHQAASRMPSVIVVQEIDRESIGAALQAARTVPVVIQLDTAVRAADIARTLVELGAERTALTSLRWAIAVQRLPALCPTCVSPAPPGPLELAALRRRLGPGEPIPDFHVARGCSACENTGRYGEVALFDIFDFGLGEPALPQERYALGLAAAGHLSLDDVLGLDGAQLRRAYNLMAVNDEALRRANAELKRRVMELESAHRVLVQRTEALNSLQRTGQVLLSDAEPGVLAEHVCRQACELCGADRAVLYRLHTDSVEVVAAAGWDRARFTLPLTPDTLLGGEGVPSQAVKFDRWPPGIPPRSPDVEGVELKAGLRVPLVAQGVPVGALVVHTTVRTRFEPSATALLETIAAQASVALQRAGLTTELRSKVAALEAAQRELVVKERMERELELARQVQQSFLPHDFPPFPPYHFAAENEPARQVGGDFYDVFGLEDGRVGLVIADVSDKGLPAALYMALTRSLIRAEARRVPSPRDVLASVNTLLLEIGEPGMFVTVFYGVLDTGTGRLIYARAGHDEPFLLRDGLAIPLAAPGLLLGAFDDAGDRLVEEEVELRPGDRLVLYTDGLTDARNPAGSLLTLGGLQVLAQHHAGEPALALCGSVFAGVRNYLAGEEQDDDMTLLIVGV